MYALFILIYIVSPGLGLSDFFFFLSLHRLIIVAISSSASLIMRACKRSDGGTGGIRINGEIPFARANLQLVSSLLLLVSPFSISQTSEKKSIWH